MEGHGNPKQELDWEFYRQPKKATLYDEVRNKINS